MKESSQIMDHNNYLPIYLYYCSMGYTFRAMFRENTFQAEDL